MANTGWLGSGALPTKLEKADIQNSFVVLTGHIDHGGVLPIPNGFSENQCKWIVSPNHTNIQNVGWDWNEETTGKHIKIECWTNGRTVHCGMVVNEGITGRGAVQKFVPGRANYMVIGIK